MIRLKSLISEAVEFTKRGNLWIDDPNNIPSSKWEQINRIMVNKGYAMRGGDDCKRAVTKFLDNPNNGEPQTINPEIYRPWVDTIATVMHINPVKPATGPSYNCRNVLRAALRAFGETQNIREAGYILPGGKLLSLASAFNRRDLDHREINTVYSKLGIEIPPDKTQSNSNVMMAFMRDCRAIRIGGSQPAADLYAPPTRQQGIRLIELIKEHNGEMMLICRSDKLGMKDHYYKEGTDPYTILRDIVHFYKSGEFLTPDS
jgi:hypothetical protein